MSHLDTWVADQIDRGIVSFVATCTQTCRASAQRLVDTKAPGLATRLDALPTRLFTLAEAARPQAAIRELGQIHLISEASRRSNDRDENLASDARQSVGWPVTREALLADPSAMRVRDRGEVFAVVTEAQPDRLRRIETWLCREQTTGDDAPRSLIARNSWRIVEDSPCPDHGPIEGSDAAQMLTRAAALKQKGVNLIVLPALSDSGHPARPISSRP